MAKTKQIRWASCGCTHGDLLDRGAAEQFLSFLRDYKPDYIVHTGDAFDFAAIRKGASDEEKAISLMADFEHGMDFLESMFAPFRRAKAKWLLLGNHDQRLLDLLESGSAIQKEFSQSLWDDIRHKLNRWGVGWKPYDSHAGVIKIGDTLFMHGYSHAVHAGHNMARSYKGNLVFSHTHRPELINAPGWPSPFRVINHGCLRQLYPKFANRTTSTLGWGHGFSYGEFDENKVSNNRLMML